MVALAIRIVMELRVKKGEWKSVPLEDKIELKREFLSICKMN